MKVGNIITLNGRNANGKLFKVIEVVVPVITSEVNVLITVSTKATIFTNLPE